MSYTNWPKLLRELDGTTEITAAAVLQRYGFLVEKVAPKIRRKVPYILWGRRMAGEGFRRPYESVYLTATGAENGAPIWVVNIQVSANARRGE